MKTKFRETAGWLVYNRKFETGAVMCFAVQFGSLDVIFFWAVELFIVH